MDVSPLICGARSHNITKLNLHFTRYSTERAGVMYLLTANTAVVRATTLSGSSDTLGFFLLSKV